MNDEYFKPTESERHFNEIQAGIRNQAATWMLAAFAAIAYLLKSDEKVTWMVSPALLIGVVSFMATMGILILWINDQMVYQRLLNSGFIIAMKMEYDNKHIPPVRLLMLLKAQGKGLSGKMTLYYSIPMMCFLAITSMAIALWQPLCEANTAFSGRPSLFGLWALGGLQLCALVWVQFKKKKVGVKELAAAFEDPEFSALFDGTDKADKDIAKLIQRYKPAEKEIAESH